MLPHVLSSVTNVKCVLFVEQSSYAPWRAILLVRAIFDELECNIFETSFLCLERD